MHSVLHIRLPEPAAPCALCAAAKVWLLLLLLLVMPLLLLLLLHARCPLRVWHCVRCTLEARGAAALCCCSVCWAGLAAALHKGRAVPAECPWPALAVCAVCCQRVPGAGHTRLDARVLLHSCVGVARPTPAHWSGRTPHTVSQLLCQQHTHTHSKQPRHPHRTPPARALMSCHAIPNNRH